MSGLDFFAVEIDAFVPGGTSLTPARGWGAAPWGALSRTLGALESTATILASDTGYRTLESDIDGLQVYPPIIESAFQIVNQLNLDPGKSVVGAQWGSISLNNADRSLDTIAKSWNSDGRQVRILHGTKTLDPTRLCYVDPSYSDLTVVFTGVALPWTLSDTSLDIPLRDGTYWLQQPLQSTLYAGTGTYEGTTDLTGHPKPKARGGTSSVPIVNVTPTLIDPVQLIYQYNDAAGTVVTLFEGGFATFTADGDVADLYSGSVAGGHYRTNNARGLFQLGSTPVATITADVTGQFPIVGAVTTAALIARYLLTEDAAMPSGTVDTASFAVTSPAVAGFARGWGAAPWGALSKVPVAPTASTEPAAAIAGVYFSSAETLDCVAAMERILPGFGGALVPNRTQLSLLLLRALAGTEMPVATFDTTNLSSLTPDPLPAAVSPPTYRTRVGYRHNYTVQTTGVSASATAARRTLMAAADAYASASSATVLAAYRRPNDLAPIPGSLLQLGDAQNVANNMIALWGTRRRLYAAVLPASVALNYEIGDIVTLAFPMDDLSGGRLAVIVGETVNSQDSSVTFSLLV